MTNEQALHGALSRLVRTPSIWAWLKDNKPEALAEAEKILKQVEGDEDRAEELLDELEEELDELEDYFEQLEEQDFEERSSAEYEADLVGSREWDFPSRG